MIGSYQPSTDTVAVDLDASAMNGMGGEDGYYVTLLHELLHATGHASRLARATTGDYSPEGYACEEGTVLEAQRIVLKTIGFEAEALHFHAPSAHGFPADRCAAADATAWVLRTARSRCTPDA